MLEHAYIMRMGRTMHNLGGGCFFEALLSEFLEVNGIFYFPELVPGSKSTVTPQNFTFSMHVDVWW